MMKFWVHRYELKPLRAIGAVADAKPRSGALLKVAWANGNVGYSDIFPWPEYGDASIEKQIAMLAKGKLTSLVEQSIWLAKKDAAIRSEKRNAFAGITKVKNHYLISDYTKFTDDEFKNARVEGFTTFKVKVGRDLKAEANFVTEILRKHAVLIRLDFGAKTNIDQFKEFVSYLNPNNLAKIEFAEDPCPWDLVNWIDASKLLPIAIDFEADRVDFNKFQVKPPFRVVVIKPTRMDLEKTLMLVNKFALKMVVTSSLDHPVGVAHALLQASELKKFYPNTLLDCGCLTTQAYEPDEFSARVKLNGPFLKEISGTGIGFDDLWEEIEWAPVK